MTIRAYWSKLRVVTSSSFSELITTQLREFHRKMSLLYLGILCQSLSHEIFHILVEIVKPFTDVIIWPEINDLLNVCSSSMPRTECEDTENISSIIKRVTRPVGKWDNAVKSNSRCMMQMTEHWRKSVGMTLRKFFTPTICFVRCRPIYDGIKWAWDRLCEGGF